MPLSRLITACFATSLLIVTSGFAIAQQPPASRVRGMIESVNGDLLIVKGRDGRNTTMKMTANAAVTGVEKIGLSDIQPGSYIGVTSVADAQGNQKATEVHLFPESNDGRTLTVKYRGGEKQVVVGPDTAVVKLVPGKRSDLREGAQIVAATARTADGVLETSRVSVGLNGITPPM